jgi:hypothetical protein
LRGVQRGVAMAEQEVEEELEEEEGGGGADDPGEALRAKAHLKAQQEHLAQAWRLAKLGCWDSAQTRMGVWDGTLLEVATDDELASDGSEDVPSDESSEVSTEGSGGGAPDSSDDADSEEDEAAAGGRPTNGDTVPSWRSEGSENSPPKILAAQQALFAAVGDALSGEVERGGDVAGAVEQFQMFAATALQRSPLNLSKPRGLRSPQPQLPWRDSESGALLLTPRGAGSEAARFFAGASATEPDAARAAATRDAVADAFAGMEADALAKMEAEAATDDESEAVISDGSDGESDTVVRTSGGNTYITEQRLEIITAPGVAAAAAAAATAAAAAPAAAPAAAAAATATGDLLSLSNVSPRTPRLT